MGLLVTAVTLLLFLSLCVYTHMHTHTRATPQKVIAYGISRGRAGLTLEEVARPARPRDIPYAITFWGVGARDDGAGGQYGVASRHTHTAVDTHTLP
jgi:hypothetical protein